MLTLNEGQKTSLRKASAKQVKDAFQNIERHFSSARWLGATNPYAEDCIMALIDQTTQPGQSIRDNDLSEYIAASAPLHCADGWGLLGRALDAHARGDASAAVHLAYYAELRAAMSILATEGIGIFDDRHFAITSSGKCEPIGKLNKRGASNLRTHLIVWLALEYWASLKRSADLFRRIIQPGGISLGEWLDAFGAGPLSNSIARKWLKTWGLDLKRLSLGEDREARNQASYRPTRLNYHGSLRVMECSDFMRKLWTCYEPSTLSRFDALDRYLLRLILKDAYKTLPKPIGQKFHDRTSKMLSTIVPGVSLAETERWKNFLTEAMQSEDPILITEAASQARVGYPRHHLQVLSRAALLLRVATGACTELLQSGPFGRTELAFWWKPLGEEHGLWKPGDEPVDLTELWGDISSAAADLHQWEAKNNGPMVSSYAKWRQDLSPQISVMCECERIALWGLGL